MPAFDKFAFASLAEAIMVGLCWDNDRMAASEVEAVHSSFLIGTNHGSSIWSSNGCGDFVRILKTSYGQRWLVNFDHESERSPWQHSKLADGFEWINDHNLETLRASDRLLMPDGPMSACEVYAYRNTFKGAFDAPEFEWVTGSLMASLDQDFSVYEKFDTDDPDAAPLEELYEKLLEGHRPTFSEMMKITDSELVASTALVVIDKIDQWLETSVFF